MTSLRHDLLFANVITKSLSTASDRAGFSWWEAWGPRDVGSSLKLGSRSRSRGGWGVGPIWETAPSL